MKNEVYIIGGGSSLKGFDFNKLKDKDTIVINKSIFYVPKANYFITLDYTFLNKINIEKFKRVTKKVTKIFVVQRSLDYIKEKYGQIMDIRNGILYDLKEFDIVIKSYNTKGIGFEWNDFRAGRDSGYAALQLAILLGYKTINLLGIDLKVENDRTHYHGGYGQTKKELKLKLDWYYEVWKEGLKLINKNQEIKIYSCSKISKLNSLIPYRRKK